MQSISILEKFTVHVQPVDAKGNPAPVDGLVTYTASVDIVDLKPSDDGLSCEVIAKKVGTCQIVAKADADLGAGVKEITGLLDVEIRAAEAVSFNMTTDPAVVQ